MKLKAGVRVPHLREEVLEDDVHDNDWEHETETYLVLQGRLFDRSVVLQGSVLNT